MLAMVLVKSTCCFLAIVVALRDCGSRASRRVPATLRCVFFRTLTTDIMMDQGMSRDSGVHEPAAADTYRMRLRNTAVKEVFANGAVDHELAVLGVSGHSAARLSPSSRPRSCSCACASRFLREHPNSRHAPCHHTCARSLSHTHIGILTQV